MKKLFIFEVWKKLEKKSDVVAVHTTDVNMALA
jgi:hypothetical protein